MKVVGDLQIIHQVDRYINIEAQIATTSGIAPDSTLEAVFLLPTEDEEMPTPRATLIATPLPESSWGRLVRMSITLNPKPGALGNLLEALTRIQLKCRYVETINDVDLQGRSIVGLDRSPCQLDQLIHESAEPHEVRLSNLIIPSTFLIVEVPPETDEIKKLGEDISEIYSRLHKVASTDPGQNRSEGSIVTLLQSVLRQKLKIISTEKGNSRLQGQGDLVAVDWISPMSTLNVLSRRMGSRRLSQRLLVTAGKEGRCQLDLSPLRHVLWDPYPMTQSTSSLEPSPLVFVKGFVDSDEKVLCWDFYQFRNDLVVQFEIKTPTAGREHLWWRWVYECMESAGGNVLASSSSARAEGGWATLATTVVFSLQEDIKNGEIGDMRAIIECFRKLQGWEGHTEHFESLVAELDTEVGETYASGIGVKEGDLRWPSVLQRVEVWDPAARLLHPIRQYEERIAPNPFNFTDPLDLEGYQKLYADGIHEPVATDEEVQSTALREKSRRKQFRFARRNVQEVADTSGPANKTIRTAALEEESLRTRRRLAMRIIQKLASEPGENIAVVGAHRAGKTTVLNLVFGILEKSIVKSGENILIPVRINAALEPPHLFFSAIGRELEARKKHSRLPYIRKGAEEYLEILSPVLKAIELGIEGLPIPLAFSLEGLAGIKKFLRKGHKATHSSEESIVLLLRQQLEALRVALVKASKNTRLVIIVDEFSESSKWGHAQALPLWRYVIESKEFSHLKWLISTSRPIRETGDYSPITNALHEFNVGSLPHDESELLIDAFSASYWKKHKLTKTGTDKSDLRPVVMFKARCFLQEVTSRLAYLLQVVCYHVYDRIMRTYFPLINRKLCIQIICDHVLPELSDYFEHQWSSIREDGRQVIQNSLNGFVDQQDFLNRLSSWNDDFRQLPQGARKDLERSGLRGDDNHSVAPLVACWLLPPRREN